MRAIENATKIIIIHFYIETFYRAFYVTRRHPTFPHLCFNNEGKKNR